MPKTKTSSYRYSEIKDNERNKEMASVGNVGITMIGTSGTGKTCYLYAMADAMQIGSCNFTFTATPYKSSVKLQQAWDSILDGKWPKGTDESSEYQFTCSYALRKLATFTWYDYRGGVLNDPDNEKEQESLFAKMNDSRCLIVCISAEVVQGVLNGDYKVNRIFKTYMSILQKYRDDTGKAVPIVFAITKADLLKEGQFAAGVEIIRTKYLASLFAADREGGWFVSFVPVSLGSNLSAGKNGEIMGVIEPANVHIPVLIAIKCAMAELLAIKNAELSGLESNLESQRESLWENQQRSGWDKFWNGDPTDSIRDTIGSLTSDRNSLSAEIAGLEGDFAQLQDEIRKCQMVVYSNGKKLA